MTEQELKQLVLDWKLARNSVYEIFNGKNFYDRQLRAKKSCNILHDMTEKYKKLLREEIDK